MKNTFSHAFAVEAWRIFLDITLIVMLFCSAVCSCLNNCFEQSEVVRSQSSDELDHESSITLDCVGASTSDKKNEFGISCS